MSELSFRPVFQELTCSFKDQPFSAMYFGRHCGKNLLILKHDLTMMLAFGEDWSTPELIKTVSFKEESKKAVEIVGSEDIILLLDETGNLWRLINAFEPIAEGCESLHSLEDRSFYEWTSFTKFHFVKVLALCAMGQGFACLGVRKNFEKKLAVLPSVDSALEDYTFEGLGTANSFSYYLISFDINIQNSVFKNELHPSEHTLLVTDRFSGKTYLCTKYEKNFLINQSNIFLISALHFQSEKCLALCFENGKLVFYFYNECLLQCAAYLPKKLVFVEKCCCCDSCLLWSDGIILHHTKLTFDCGENFVKMSHLKLNCAVESPLSLLKIHKHILTVTVNNIYYLIGAESGQAVEIRKQTKELLSEISKSSNIIEKLEKKTEMLSHYLQCKEIIQTDEVKEKVQMRWEGNNLIIKSCLAICFKQEFWKIQLKTWVGDKEYVHVIDLEFDMSHGMFITITNPFKSKNNVKVSLVGDFNGKGLFFDLGEIGNCTNFESDEMSKILKKTLYKRNPFFKG